MTTMKTVGNYDHRKSWRRQAPPTQNTRPPRPDCSPGPWLPIRLDADTAEPELDFVPDDLPGLADMLIRVYWHETGIDLAQPHDQDDIGQDFRLWCLRRYRDSRENRDDPARRILTNRIARHQLRYLVETRFYRAPQLSVIQYQTAEDQEKDLDRLRIAQAAALRDYEPLPTPNPKPRASYRYA